MAVRNGLRLAASGLIWGLAVAGIASAQHGHGGHHHHIGHHVGHHLGHRLGGIHVHFGGYGHVGHYRYGYYRRRLIPSYRQYLVHVPHRHYGYGHHHYRYSYYGGFWGGLGWYSSYYWPVYYPPVFYYPLPFPGWCSPMVISQPIIIPGGAKDREPREQPKADDPAQGQAAMAGVLANLGPLRQAVQRQDLMGMVNVLKAQQIVERARVRRAAAGNVRLARFLGIDPPDEQQGGAADRTVEALVRKADQAWRRGQYELAADRYEQALEREPARLETWLRLAFAALASEDWDRSLAAFRSAAKLRGDLEPGDFDLGSIYADRSVKLQHLDQLAKAALRRPDSPDMWLLVGTFLWFDGQSERAGKFLAKAQTLSRSERPLMLVQALSPPAAR